MVEYLYRHLVTGTVVTDDGQPVPDAVVYPSLGSDGLTPYGRPGLWERMTDAHGRFAFEENGLGPRPQAAMRWHVAVRSRQNDWTGRRVERGLR